MRRGVSVFLAVAALLVLLPAMARAQEGQIAGSVRDASDALMPGVTVEVASPALIEKVRYCHHGLEWPVPHDQPAGRHSTK